MIGRALCAFVVIAGSVARAGEPVSVAVAAADLPSGTTVAASSLRFAKAPSTEISIAVVKESDVRYVIDQRLVRPLLKGDLVLWSFFETTARSRIDDCRKAMKTPATARGEVARHRRVVLGK